MAFTITKGANSVVLPNPEFGNRLGTRKKQVSAESVGGTFYVYDRGAKVQNLAFTWRNLDKAHFDAMESFFDTHADGMVNLVDLSWSDWQDPIFGGAGGTVTKTGYRFVAPELEWTEQRNALFSLTLVFRSN